MYTQAKHQLHLNYELLTEMPFKSIEIVSDAVNECLKLNTNPPNPSTQSHRREHPEPEQ